MGFGDPGLHKVLKVKKCKVFPLYYVYATMYCGESFETLADTSIKTSFYILVSVIHSKLFLVFPGTK